MGQGRPGHRAGAESGRLKMRLAFVTTQFPFGSKESFLEAEVRAVRELVDELFIFAARPASSSPRVAVEASSLRATDVATISGAARTFLRHPIKAASVVSGIFDSQSRPGARLRNALVLHQGLALADLVRRKRIDHIHAHWLTTASTIAMIAGESTGTPWSCTGHRFDIFAGNALHSKARSARFMRVVCERARANLVDRIGDDDWPKVNVVHMGVTLPELPTAPTRRECLRLLCAANLVPVKGHEALLDALKIATSDGVRVHCDLAGDGPEHGRIAAAIERLGLADVVTLRGRVPHSILMGELRAGRYDAVTLSSLESGTEFEGIPVFLMEAMAAGVPCIATRTGSIPELLNMDCGILVEQRDPQAMASAFKRLLDDFELRRSLASAARARVANDFDAARTAEQLIALVTGTSKL